ncbi:MAG: hypothetical protein C3F11_15430 [Methylocystaceae bacterium]|nr:MAG: hypothetical protein C3F11_15430 [Methylocystaceae bacterium]
MHFTLFMHEGPPVEMACRLAESDHEEKHRVTEGQFHLLPAARAADVRWKGEKQSLVIGFEKNFLECAVGDAFEGNAPEISSRAALCDPAIEALVACVRRETTRNNTCSRLLLEYLGASLVVRLFETYGNGARPLPRIKGGLGDRRQRRVLEFIEEHLNENLSLAALAAEAGLSTHHFGKAFKGSLDIAPWRYVTKRRIHRAKELLLMDHQSITEIAYALGFSSHSHLSETFRRATGMTPSEFRSKQD